MSNHYDFRETHFYREQTQTLTKSMNGVMSPNKRCHFCWQHCNKDVKKVKGTGTSRHNPAVRYCTKEECTAKGKELEAALAQALKDAGLYVKRRRGKAANAQS